MERYYREQAAACAREADETMLVQVRERYRRAEHAWLAMADRAARATRFRTAGAVPAEPLPSANA